MVTLLIVAALAGCDAQKNADDVGIGKDGQPLTVGKVQREVARGMTGAQVIEALGSPNIVTTEEGGREVWVYDRFATDVRYSQSAGGVWLILAAFSNSTGAASTSQRSLTVVIKFDDAKHVRDVAYHSMQF